MVTLRAATRGSRLARWQTDHIAALLGALDPSVDVVPTVVSTSGDQRTDVPIHAIGGKGVFVKEVQLAVLEGRADIAVHSGKDLPALTPEGLVIAAVPPRADPLDVLIGSRLGSLRAGAVIATGSVRRRVQLAAYCPGLEFVELRGNIDTRVARAGEFDAIVLAAAGLDRLGLHPEVVDPIPLSTMVPQVAQGALAVECRAGDDRTRELLQRIEDAGDRRVFDAERAFLAELGGDCDLPAGAHGVVDPDGSITLHAVLAEAETGPPHRLTSRGQNGEAVGRELARRLRDLVDTRRT